MKRIFLLLTLLTSSAIAQINIVAAENMYGNIAQTIGGNAVNVSSILNNPNQDPHLFNTDPNTAKKLATADIIIVNGADYDPWAIKLAQSSHAQILNVATLNNIAEGANPHLWYNLAYVEKFSQALTTTLTQQDPSQKKIFEKNLKQFLDQAKKVQTQIDQLKTLYPNLSVTATEPVAGYILQALALNILDQHFQLSVMNDTEPSAQDRAQMINDLSKHKVALLIYNQQVTDPTTNVIRIAAQSAGIPIVGVSELMPSNTDYLSWYQSTLNNIATALKKS